MEQKFILPVVIIVILLLLWAGYVMVKAYLNRNVEQNPMDEGLADLEKKLNEEKLQSVFKENVKPAEIKHEKAEGKKSMSEVSALRGESLWQWWAANTGDWNLPLAMITLAAAKLTAEQKNELLQRYRKDHPDLYQGIKTDINWEKRADVYAKVIGQRIAVLIRK